MHIITLGTSHGDSTYCRFNSSTLYESGDSLYLVDCGAPCEALLLRKNKDFSRVRAVFCTHMDNDHVGGLTELIKMLVKYADPKNHTTVYLTEPGAEKALKTWLNVMHVHPREEVVSFKLVNSGMIYSDGNITVSAYPTEHIPPSHGRANSYFYVIEEVNKRVLHTGDLCGDFHDYPKVLFDEHFDLLICESTHYDMVKAQHQFAQSKVDRLLFNHVSNEWHGDGEARLVEICKKLPYPVMVAHDGDEFDV